MYRYVLLEKCRKTVQVGTYRYVPVQENVKKYVRVRTQLRTERYRAVQLGTGQYTKWYKRQYRSKYNKVQGSTCIWNPKEVYSRYILVPCIYHVYSEGQDIPGTSISQVYTLDIEILFSWIYGQVNAVSQNND
jgi:hypothetical protein